MSKIESNPPASSTPALPESRKVFLSSQTFLARIPPPPVIWARILAVGAVGIIFLFLIPLLTELGVIPDYRLNLLGKYLSFAMVALGIDLIWGYTGILSLCQALFFCLGGYAMAMHLSLPEGGGVFQIPQFMEFAYYGHHGELPPFWRPFSSFTFALTVGFLLPAAVAAFFGFFIFRSRVRGVYFSIITQAVAWGTFLQISRNEMLLGGTNGLTNFYRPLSQDRHWILGLYFLTVITVIAGYLICRAIVKSQTGRVMIAVRDKETRLYFAGYQPYAFKVFAFMVAAILAGAGGMLYVPQVGIITPQDMNVDASILMVVWVALGGRGKLWGAILGALVVNVLRGSLSSDLPGIWPFLLGGLAMAVILLFPEGFVGIWSKMERQLTAGAGLLRAGITLSPLLVIVIFVLMEMLQLEPRFLATVMFHQDKIGDVSVKYLVLILLMAGSFLAEYWVGESPSKAKVTAEPEPSESGKG
jgi:urea transport system permease protein